MKKEAMNWLLGEDNPPVRYLTLRNLLDKPEDDPEVLETAGKLMSCKVTVEILKHAENLLTEKESSGNYYWKYSNKYWQLIFLSQFLADGSDTRIGKLVKDILTHRKWNLKSKWQCFTAIFLNALVRLGYGEHPVVAEEVENMAVRLVKEKGISCHEMDYSLLPCCYMARPKFLLLFGSIPEEKRSMNVKAAIRQMVDTLIENHVYMYVPSIRKEWRTLVDNGPKASELPKGQTRKSWIASKREEFLTTHGQYKKDPKQGWTKFGFPQHYNSDILETVYSLALLNIPMHPNLEPSLKVIRDKMTREGKWLMDRTLNGKMLVDVEEKNSPCKWITYQALYVLKQYVF